MSIPSSETKLGFLWQQKCTMSSTCWSVKSITVGRSLQATSRMNPEKEPFRSSSTVISGSLLLFDAAEDVRPSWCFMVFTCRTFLGRELKLSAPQTPPLSFMVLKSTRLGFVFFSDWFCTRHCFVLSFVFTYGGAEDSSLQFPWGTTLNFLGFPSQ